eukprot:TRINITY_DN9505_c0_g1_i1.p1 TRINITY_DN9505_c0_g1~~TRINITY_DN9505_c0_g1_i1.p1  ORF type:complete len:204 (-),score=66.01 TRINITY_DN9505_c0_g1_i1:206-817(-)
MSKTGVVKFFNATKGFGFISQDDMREDLFAHVNDIRDGQCLVEGDTVRYDEDWNDVKGKSLAQNITGGTGGDVEAFESGKGDRGKGKGGYGGGKDGYKGGKGYGKSKGGGGDGKSIFVNGFDFGAEAAALEDHFGGMGRIQNLYFQGKGSAVITFEDESSAQRAVEELDRSTISGHSRFVSVKIDGERGGKGKKGSGKGKYYD